MAETPDMDLLHQITFKMVNDSHASHRALEDSLRYDLNRTRATLELVRERIDDLLSGPYAPSERLLRAALYPAEKDVEAVARSYEGTVT